MTITVHALEDGRWEARRDGSMVGAVSRWVAPNGTQRLSFDQTAPAAYAPLLKKLPGACVTFVDDADVDAVEALLAEGFEVSRRELQFEIPIARTVYELPAGYRLINAHSGGIRELMALDAALRDDVPGSAGWVEDEESFRAQTYDSPYFDAETYLIALDPADQHAGLVRVWNGPRPLPRLGMIGVLPDHRRIGLAQALISAAFNVLADRGESTAIAEADETNTASRTLLTNFGARPVATELELTRAS